ncbi:vWA domain-containing protein [Corynebacterium halotolerans]|uniref:VWFA domain-containing protein n=1 Tax=Corynebacterium halotolerans YIM 70093 = DSM 44683 TaxID=1121362 RepID=M1NM20_9CORY|nr:vWA domain-containing protein [Corynebacterium halotolerans]AGF72423.1 hypothetical protein A605_07105 [Corynebacterium halotolerans YIM 70093 = DSM 44683]
MGRHSNGKNNYAVSTNVIIAIVVILALIAGLVWWFWVRDAAEPGQTQAEGECIEGELILPVAASSPTVAEDLMADWSGTDPVVRDHCVTPQLVDDPAEAAVYVAADSPATTAVLEEAGRTAASSEHPVVAEGTVGVAGRGQAPTIEDIDAAEVAYPVADQTGAAVTASAALAGADAAPELVARDRELSVGQAVGDEAPLIAVTENTVPEGYEFTALPDARILYSAIPLNPAGEVSEEQSRAGAEFARHAEENSGVSAEDPAGEQPDLSAVWAAAAGEQTPGTESETTTEAAPEETQPPAEDPAPAPVPATDTLLLLDTSRNMSAPFGGGSLYSTAADVLSAVALDLGGQGHGVALWNYSSPINPGVTDGWRRNVNFSGGQAAADAIQRFGTGGVPQTRSAVVAAVANASDRSNEIGAPVRVLLVTSATAQDMDDPTFRDALQRSRHGNVILDVVHVGTEGIDPLLAELADSHTRANTPEELTALVRGTVGL